MDIEHLIMSGGGPVFGLYVYGVLNNLFNNDAISISKIKTIHGCSAGSIVGALLCLKYDWSDLTDYIVGKPWDKIVNIEPEDILNVSNQKGVLERKFFEEIFSSLLLAKDLQVNTTLKQLYEFSGIELHIYTSKVDTFEYVDMSHVTHPDLQIIDATYMSSAIPFIFKPVKYCGDHFIDGGIIKNFPLDTFKEKNPDVSDDKILGITLNHRENKVDCEAMSILEYASFIYRNQLILLDRQRYKPNNLIDITIDFAEVFNFFTIFRNSSMREEIINKKSVCVAEEFLEKVKAYQSQ
jgi:predicted acylesterase/phospholipase RssA